jgi:hypothetical protein
MATHIARRVPTGRSSAIDIRKLLLSRCNLLLLGCAGCVLLSGIKDEPLFVHEAYLYISSPVVSIVKVIPLQS